MTVRTYAQILTEIASGFPSGIPGFVTAAGARGVYTDMMDSTFLSTVGQGAYNPNDIGFDIVLVIGDSTPKNGHSIVLTRDVSNPNRLWQWNQFAGFGLAANAVNPAAEPLLYPIIAGQDPGEHTGLAGPVIPFCRRLLLDLPANRSILIVPQAIDGTGLVNVPHTGNATPNNGWAPPNKTGQVDIFCTGAGSIGDTETINGVTMSSTAGANSGFGFQYSATAQTYAENFRSCIVTNGATIGVNAPNPSVGGLFTVYANAPGSASNYVCDGTKTGTFYSFYFNSIDVNNGYPTASIGAGLTGGSDGGGGFGYTSAIAQTNLAVAAGPNNRVKCILCDIGTNDSRMSSSQFTTWYLGMIDGLRTGINSPNCPFVEIGIVPEYAFNIIGGLGDFLKAKYLTQSNIASLRAFTAFAPCSYGNQDQNLGGQIYHPDAIISYWNGSVSAYNAYLRASTWQVAETVNNTFVSSGPIINSTFFYTVSPTDTTVVMASPTFPTSVTMPDPTTCPGRWLFFKATAQAVSSASSNIASLTGVTSTAILSGAGKWAALQADSANAVWQIMMGN